MHVYAQVCMCVCTFVENDCDSSSIRDFSVAIDHKSFSNPYRFFTAASRSPIFHVLLPPDNLFGADETVIPELLLGPSAHAGFYVLVKPLRTGKHVIEWTATWDCDAGTFSENIRYDLVVLDASSNRHGGGDKHHH